MLRKITLCLVSVPLLILSFPKTDFWILAWIALIPFFMAVDNERPRASFGIGYGTGFLFFLGMFFWLRYVTYLGMFLMVAYFALYFAVFAYVYALWQKEKFLNRLFFLSSAWVALEYIRGHLLSGLNWVSLAHSQYKNLIFLQSADITGAAGLSFLIVMVNLFLKEIFLDTKGKINFDRPERNLSVGIVGVVLILTFAHGVYHLQKHNGTAKIKIAVIQPNIPLSIHWDLSRRAEIVDKHINLTSQALSDGPGLIVWSETAFPGLVDDAPQLFEKIKHFAGQIQIPILMGVITTDGLRYFNSAVLISKDGTVTKQYDKLHLVPFGEYIPFRKTFPLLEKIVPIDDFTAGSEYTLFSIQKYHVAALICFEDTIPELARHFTRRGADLLINITNDAWFGDTKAPFLHLANSVFRAVENRRALVRSANTGVSAFVDTHGRIIDSVKTAEGKKVDIEGVSVAEVAFNTEQTFYSKFGDVFTYLCFGCILWGIGNRVFKGRVKYGT